MSPRVMLDLPMSTRDGVTLSSDVYLPPTGESFPTLLCRTPYDNQMPYYVDWALRFADEGFAAVIQDCRGRYDSAGTWRPYVDEASDGYDAHAWLVEQPWCNGRIGTFGFSYVGFTQILPAPLDPPGLSAVFPIGNQEDNYGHIWCDGVLQLESALNFFHLGRRTMQSAGAAALDMPPIYRRLPLSQALDDISDCPPYREFLRHPTCDEFWLEASMKGRYKDVAVPAMFLTGWYDNLVHEQCKLFRAWRSEARTDEARNRTRLVVGPWTHYEIGERVAGEVDFGDAAELDVPGLQVRWYRERLEGATTGIDDEPPVRLFTMGRNGWRWATDWPPEDSHQVSLYLTSDGHANTADGDGRLALQPSDGPPDSFSYDPDDPVPTVGGTSQFWGGPRDRREVERRDDVLVYDTALLQDQVEVTGEVLLYLHAATSAADTDFAASLVDVHPDGRAMIVCEGIVAGRYSGGTEREVPVGGGEPSEIRVSLWETSMVFGRGHRIRLEVTSSNFPRFARNLNSGESLADGTTIVVAEQRVFHDLERPSRLVLPVVGEGLVASA